MKLSEIVKEKLEKCGIKLASCRSCGEAIFFISTAKNKLMPLGLDLTPHWKTCNNPQQFRRKGNKQAEDEPEKDMEDLPI